MRFYDFAETLRDVAFAQKTSNAIVINFKDGESMSFVLDENPSNGAPILKITGTIRGLETRVLQTMEWSSADGFAYGSCTLN